MSDLPQRRSRAVKDTEVSRPRPATAVTPATPPTAEIDLIELMYRLLSSWKLIVCLALVFAIAAGAYVTYFVTPLYQATSVIYIVSRDSVINMSDLQLGSALAQDYIRIFSMWELHAEVISKLGLPYSTATMRDMVSVRNTTGTHMLDITVTSASPEEAAMIANEYASIASQYIADTMSTDKPNIMSAALVPRSPVNINKNRRVMQGFLIGAALAMAIVTLHMLLDDKYKTADMIRKYTGLAKLAIIPLDESMKDHKHRR